MEERLRPSLLRFVFLGLALFSRVLESSCRSPKNARSSDNKEKEGGDGGEASDPFLTGIFYKSLVTTECNLIFGRGREVFKAKKI